MPRPDWEQTNPAKADFIRNKPQWSKGDGEYSVTCGTNSSAFGDCSMAFGTDTIAGVKGFNIGWIDASAKTIILTTQDVKPILPSWSENTTDYYAQNVFNDGIDLSNYYAVGDQFSIQASGYFHWLLCGTIAAIDGNIIYVNEVISDSNGRINGLDPNANWESATYQNVRFHFSVPTKAGIGEVSTGDGSFAFGNGSVAATFAARAEGNHTLAYGMYAHTEGYSTKASYNGHAEGKDTHAKGFYSHAEGHSTLASGQMAHAEGFQTEAIGAYSHSEGYGTSATAESSHAEGYQTAANGKYAHAGGKGSVASGEMSLAFGESTVASGSRAFAGGNKSQALKPNSFAYGLTSIAEGNHSFAVGHTTHTYGESSFAEGQLTSASGVASHAEGYNTQAMGKYSHAGGKGTIASGDHSFAAGEGSIAEGNRAFAIGNSTKATAPNSFAHGLRAVASGNHSFATGQETIASGYAQLVHGQYNVADTENKYAHIVGWGTSDTNRKNIHTLDTSGNAWFAGSVFAANIPVEHPDYPGCYYRTVDGETEWINPPMVEGVEYRTAERWSGSPVYTKLIDFGAMPAATMKAVKHNLGSTQIVRYWAQVSDGTALPYNDGNVIVNASCNYTSLIIVSNIDQSTTNTAKFQVWYTK